MRKPGGRLSQPQLQPIKSMRHEGNSCLLGRKIKRGQQDIRRTERPMKP